MTCKWKRSEYKLKKLRGSSVGDLQGSLKTCKRSLKMTIFKRSIKDPLKISNEISTSTPYCIIQCINIFKWTMSYTLRTTRVRCVIKWDQKWFLVALFFMKENTTPCTPLSTSTCERLCVAKLWEIAAVTHKFKVLLSWLLTMMTQEVQPLLCVPISWPSQLQS